jgi:AraC-like DNA-binding protein
MEWRSTISIASLRLPNGAGNDYENKIHICSESFHLEVNVLQLSDSNRKPPVEKLKNVAGEHLRLRRGATVIGDILYAPGGACGPRVQHDYQLVVIHKGALNLSLDGEEMHVGRGQGILLSPGHREHFRFSTETETHHSWCAIDPEAVPTDMQKDFQTHRGPIPFVGRMLRILQLMERAQPFPDDPLQAGFYLGLGLALFCDFSLAVRNGQVGKSPGGAVLLKLDQIISGRYSDPLTLLEISRAIGVSRQHLLKVCRMEGKPTPMVQLYQARVEAAMDLLQQTGLSVNEIAEKCGFVNVFHFSRKFKEISGFSPRTWRRGAWQRSVYDLSKR